MKPLSEIRYRLCGIGALILMYHTGNSIPDGWAGAVCFVLAVGAGVCLGSFATNFLIAFKNWWRE